VLVQGLGPNPRAGWANRPAVTSPQRPTLFTGLSGTNFLVRPPWPVAGVDYGVGVPSAQVLKDPLVDTLPTGATADTVNKLIRCNSTNDLTFNGWDFSLNDGYTLYCNGTTHNTTILNSKFSVGANGKGAIQCDNGAGTITVRYCEMDGGGGDFTPAGGVGYLIRGGALAGAEFIVEYNYLKRFHADCLSPGSGNDIQVRYNLFEEGMWDATGAAHSDLLQTQSIPIGEFDFSFNTLWQPDVASEGLPGALNAVIIFSSLSGVADSVDIGHNSFVGVGTTHQTLTGDNGKALNYFAFLAADLPAEMLNPRVHDNYIDPTSLNGFIYPTPGDGVSGASFLRNIKLTDGTTFAAPY
jgi:hypothetical protein